MKITVLCVGKIKEKFYREALEEYRKRLCRYCNLDIIEVADEKTVENASENVNDIVRSKEGERLLKHIRENDYVITLEIQGKEIDSIALSNHIMRLGVEGKSSIVFVIGGSLGLDNRVLKRSNFPLSFSRMTFPHQLMRVILLEQVYRGYRIMNHEPYHK